MEASADDPPSRAFVEAFRAAAGPDAILRFDRFVELALYHPALGYYRRPRLRVGRAPGTDFYTATTSGTVFGELVAAAAVTLLGGRDPRHFRFVELGAEPSGGVLRDVIHPFREAVACGVGEDAPLEGDCIVFSNELFDAQPFRRFVRRGDAWRETHVTLANDLQLSETDLPVADADFLPETAPPDYRLDAPVASVRLAEGICRRPWRGLFLAFDYGKSWTQLVQSTPQGTARAYHRHRQHNDLLARPGEQDLTCHVCWDWLSRALADSGLGPVRLESQETFFMRHAGIRIEALMTAAAAAGRSPARSLLQLLHPSYLGQKFEVLHASRFTGEDSP
jgi:SAM-dependent MidA family methyltransferase